VAPAGIGGPPRHVTPPPRGRFEPRAAPATFSVVIPAYQAAATIAASVRSALEQAYAPHEVIVVDDGSTDDPAAALAGFGDRVRVVRKTNGGNGSALNAGAALATGEFFAILDADDTYHPRRLEVLAGLAAERPDLDLVTTDARFVVNGRGVGTFHQFNAFEVGDQRSAILRGCFVGGWPAVRVERLRAIGLFDETLRTGADWDCWLRLILDGAQAGLVDEPYYDYHLHGGGLTASRVSSLWDRVRVLEHAAANPSLRDAERRVLAWSLRRHRTRATLAELDAALARGGSSRGWMLRRALARDIALRARVAAALSAASPGAGRRLVPRDTAPEERFGP
jgi:hypothetical protein